MTGLSGAELMSIVGGLTVVLLFIYKLIAVYKVDGTRELIRAEVEAVMAEYFQTHTKNIEEHKQNIERLIERDSKKALDISNLQSSEISQDKELMRLDTEQHRFSEMVNTKLDNIHKELINLIRASSRRMNDDTD